MPTLFLALSLFTAAPSLAADSLCGKTVVCGTFEAVNNGNTSTIVVSDAGENKINMAFVRNGEQQSSRTMHFRAEGAFNFGEPGQEIGTGVCQDQTCYLSQIPFLNDGVYLSIFQIFRFSEDVLTFEKLMSTSDGQQKKTIAAFYRKK